MIYQIDARGLRCPWPAIRLARALREGFAIIDIEADDPAAAAELTRVAQAQRADIAVLSGGRSGTFRVTKASAVNGSFTRNG